MAVTGHPLHTRALARNYCYYGPGRQQIWMDWTYPAPAAWLEPLPRPPQDQDNGIDPERFINSLGGDRLRALHSPRVFALDSGHPLLQS